MASAAVGPFFVQSVVVGGTLPPARSIFSDVEACKLRTIKARKAAKRRIESVPRNERQSQLSELTIGTNSLQDNDQVKTATQALLQSESDLLEVRAVRTALQERRIQINDEITSLAAKLSTLISSTAGAGLSAPGRLQNPTQPKKRQRYFEDDRSEDVPMPGEAMAERLTSSRESEQQEDLSSVICPFELMGSCTDPKCPHMHLNR